ncbi:MAG: FAD-dependent oxidoreductase [Labilithrix sp.]|nr:FAD-dependent oxidoreductase [Labilithrix sp.]MCW5811904.1 FAD-dependent oxidoreductase [Labilithrix sp.]
MSKKITVVGGGPAGLAAATYCARAGHRVTVLERAQEVGGRAASRTHAGFSFNQGLRALYRGGPAESVLRELDAMPAGTLAPTNDSFLWSKGELTALPVGFVTLATTGALPARSKLTAARVLLALDRAPLESFPDAPLRSCIESLTDDVAVRRLLHVVFSIATYTKNHELVSARRAIAQLRRAARRGVLYLDGGWGPMCTALRERALAAGVTVRTGATAAAVLGDHVRLEAGEAIPHDACILAIPPRAAAALGIGGVRETEPILASCLDVAVSKLPEPRRRFVVGLDVPFFFNVQSLVAKMAPPGGALLGIIEYLGPGERGERATLEAILDSLQYGWRDHVVHAQFLPRMTVAADHPRGGASVRTALANVFGAGDGWGDEMLFDGALESAREAAMLAATVRSATNAGRVEARVA